MTERQKRLMRQAGAASVSVATLLIVLKTWAWLTTGSVSLLSSLADSLLDLIASMITLLAIRVAMEPADREHRFGHGKSEAIAGLLQAVIVTGSAIFVAVRAVARLVSPAQIEAAWAGYTVIGASLVLTLLLVGFQRYVVAQTASLAITADSVHYKADVLTNIAVLAALYLNARLGWYAADPLLALGIVVLILLSVRTIAVDALDVLLDRELPSSVRDDIRAIAHGHPDVRGVHDIRTRASGSAHWFLQFHLELDPSLTLSEAHEICDIVESEVRQKFPAAEVLIHADPHGLAEPRDTF
jgi:ferrous-iron efflux pump FieF